MIHDPPSEKKPLQSHPDLHTGLPSHLLFLITSPPPTPPPLSYQLPDWNEDGGAQTRRKQTRNLPKTRPAKGRRDAGTNQTLQKCCLPFFFSGFFFFLLRQMV